MARQTDKLAVRVLEAIPKRLWGFPPRLMPVIVEQLGAARATAWFLTNMPRYEWTLRQLGGVRTHLLSTTISLINGCPYCTFGHAYALELIHLRERDALFPLDEHEITALHTLDRAELKERLLDAVRRGGLEAEVPWVERLFAMAADPGRPADRDGARLAHLVRMFGVLNSCGIAGAVKPDQAHDPANKDSALKSRYAQRRAATAT